MNAGHSFTILTYGRYNIAEKFSTVHEQLRQQEDRPSSWITQSECTLGIGRRESEAAFHLPSSLPSCPHGPGSTSVTQKRRGGCAHCVRERRKRRRRKASGFIVRADGGRKGSEFDKFWVLNQGILFCF